jgi:hypothetical protein
LNIGAYAIFAVHTITRSELMQLNYYASIPSNL